MGQLLGFFYALFLILSSWGKSVKQILVMQTISFIFKGFHYYLLGGLSGFLTSIISAIRNLIFYKLKKSTVLSVIFILLYLIIGFATYQDVFSLIPVLATIFYTIIINKNKENYLRLGLLITSFLWLIYNIYLLSYSGIIVQIINLFSSVLAMIKLDKRK